MFYPLENIIYLLYFSLKSIAEKVRKTKLDF